MRLVIDISKGLEKVLTDAVFNGITKAYSEMMHERVAGINKMLEPKGRDIIKFLKSCPNYSATEKEIFAKINAKTRRELKKLVKSGQITCMDIPRAEVLYEIA